MHLNKRAVSHLQIFMVWTGHLQFDLLLTAPTAAPHRLGFKHRLSLLSGLSRQQLSAGSWNPGEVQGCFERRLVSRLITDGSKDRSAKIAVGEKLGCMFVLGRRVIKCLAFQLNVMWST